MAPPYAIYSKFGLVGVEKTIEEAEKRKPRKGYVEKVNIFEARRLRKELKEKYKQARKLVDEETPLERIAD